MSREYVLLVALYADSDEAVADLRDLTAPGGLAEVVVGSGILHRGWGRSVLQQGDGGTLAYGIGTGAAAGVVAGAFLALPLVGAAVGAVIGGLVGRRVRRGEVEGLVALLDDSVPVGATALLAVVAEDRLVEVRARLDRALRSSGRVLDEGPLTTYVRTFVRGNPEALEALDRQAGRSADA
ncbi:MAG TPA: DUF1269 domain-containing protein [Candidatus Limnocylindrales bacterium]|nr:DUF1269 domain-containing protein [Candidatus Limnocylindrales bacterium]